MFLVFDLETTQREPTKAHVIEWAYVLMTIDGFFKSSNHGLVKPPIPIPPESSAVHQIIDSDVVEMPPWDAIAKMLRNVISSYLPVALVAHNAQFEQHFLGVLASDVPWICTYKSALRIWPDAPGHSNETLRYWLGTNNLGRRFPQQPHSAYHDAKVTAGILTHLLQEAGVAELVQWTQEPVLLPRCPIGQYRNLPWAEVPIDWMEWALYKATDMREDVVHACRLEIARRDVIEAQTGESQIDNDEIPF